MGRRELCPCCLQQVTQTQLKAHAEEAERRRSIISMGRDPNTPAATLRVVPITGNDIFESRALAPSPPVDDRGASIPNDLSSFPTPNNFIAPHPIEDDDFPPDPIDHLNDPPQVPESPDYPSMEAPDIDTDEDEEDKERVQDKPNLEEFMDWEYLQQGKPQLPCISLYQC